MKKTFIIVVFTFTILNFASHVIAQPDRISDEWQFALSPLFLWGMNVNGPVVGINFKW